MTDNLSGKGSSIRTTKNYYLASTASTLTNRNHTTNMSGDWTVNASVTWQEGDNTEIRVYGLKPDGTLVEWVYSRRWHEPQALGVKATPDTPLSAIMFHNGDGVQVSHQGSAREDLKLTVSVDSSILSL